MIDWEQGECIPVFKDDDLGLTPTPATLVIGPGKVFTEEEVKAILTKVDEVIECYFDTYGHMGGDAHDLQEEFRDIVLKHGLTI